MCSVNSKCISCWLEINKYFLSESTIGRVCLKQNTLDDESKRRWSRVKFWVEQPDLAKFSAVLLFFLEKQYKVGKIEALTILFLLTFKLC